MAVRSIASLSLTFGLVSIPVKLYSATESSTALRFKWMAAGGGRIRQQYVADVTPISPEVSEPQPAPSIAAAKTSVASQGATGEHSASLPPARLYAAPEPAPVAPVEETVIERSGMRKGYEYEKGKFVLFTQQELRALEVGSRKTIDIVSFIPVDAIDPIYYDKAYFLAPDKAGAKPYTLLLRAMRETQRCALARWAFRSKEYVVQIRASEGAIILQQLLYADEVRSLASLRVEPSAVGDAELELAKRLIEQISVDTYDPTEFVDEEKQRILAAVADKIAGKQMAAPPEAPRNAKVIDLMSALRASLQQREGLGHGDRSSKGPAVERQPAKRAVNRRESSKSPKKRKA
jgi:DNA end-binding protein Ku